MCCRRPPSSDGVLAPGMTFSTNEPRWMPYIPKLVYRDVVPVDPPHAASLRARDLEVITTFGDFVRRVIPIEFTPDVMAQLDDDSYVQVTFAAGRWLRYRSEPD